MKKFLHTCGMLAVILAPGSGHRVSVLVFRETEPGGNGNAGEKRGERMDILYLKIDKNIKFRERK